MSDDIRVQLLLSDRGTVDHGSGGLNLLNAGWRSATLSPDAGLSFALAAFVEVPEDQCGVDFSLSLELVTHDGDIVRDAGGRPVVVGQVLNIVRRPHAPSGSPGVGTILIEFTSPGLALVPGAQYVWRATINDKGNPQWQVDFWVTTPR